MTENEIIEILQTEKACVTRAMNNECNRDCYNCDLCEDGKDILAGYDAIIKAIEENQQYRAIGTIEEFKTLKEKNEPKKPTYNTYGDMEHRCPECENRVSGYEETIHWCFECGQKIGWSE